MLLESWILRRAIILIHPFLLIMRATLPNPVLHLTPEFLPQWSIHPPIIFYLSNPSCFSPIFWKWFHHIISLCSNPQSSLLHPVQVLSALSLAPSTCPSSSALTGHRSSLDFSPSSKPFPTCLLAPTVTSLSRSLQASPFL